MNGADFSTLVIEHGVPQGCIFGSLLFIININDIPETALKFARFIHCARDANIEEIGDQLANRLAILYANYLI